MEERVCGVMGLDSRTWGRDIRGNFLGEEFDLSPEGDGDIGK